MSSCGDSVPGPLCEAIEARDLAEVQALLENGETVTPAAVELATDPLIIATRLRGSHASINSSRTTALAEAIQRRDVTLIALRENAGAVEWQ